MLLSTTSISLALTSFIIRENCESVGRCLIERDEEELGNLRLGREDSEDMFLVTEKVDDGVVCIEGWQGGIKGSPCVAGIMPERESVAERLAWMAPG